MRVHCICSEYMCRRYLPATSPTRARTWVTIGADHTASIVTLCTACQSAPYPASVVQSFLGIPEVEINVLSYSEDVSKRFVMIGQNIFKEGEEVVEGLVISEIRNTDVIFGFDGIKFIMEP